MIVQIYEIASLEEAKKMMKIGVDHIGFLVGKGEHPRELTIEKAAMIFRSLPLGAQKVALSLSSDLQDIFEIIDQLRLDILHLGADEHKLPINKVQTIRKKYPELKIMRTIAVINEDSIELAKKYEEISDYLLLDTYKSQLGATGEIHDWNISEKIVESVRIPVILAGGLGPDNVKEAIRKVSPAGVDSKTKTDQGNTHQKDIEKVKKFISVVKSFE